MILLRLARFSEETIAFAQRLRRESGMRVACIVDERNGPVDVGDFDKVSLTRAACRAIGLHCPRDVGWRCGDYGFYLARLRYPDVRFFWLMEYDVRLRCLDLGEFFSRYAPDRGPASVDHDLIAGYYRQAAGDWYWTHTMIARDRPVWRCLFPVVRLSARAIDTLHAERRAYARRPVRLANWPNDESFVATVLTRNGSRCADLNDFGATVYDRSTYSFDEPIDGSALDDRATPVRLYHPVLFGADLARKIKRMAWIDKGESVPRKVKRRLIGAWNRRSTT